MSEQVLNELVAQAQVQIAVQALLQPAQAQASSYEQLLEPAQVQIAAPARLHARPQTQALALEWGTDQTAQFA